MALVLVQFAFAQQVCNVTFTSAFSQTNPLQLTVTNTTNWTLISGSTPNMWIQWGDGPNVSNINYTFGSTATHTYANPGSYVVNMTGQYWDSLNNSLHCYDSTFQVVVANQPCASSITTTNNGGGSYSFVANNIGGGTGMAYSWNFGDGGTATGASVNHTYVASGSYTVTLVATGSGCAHTSTATVNYFNGTVNCTNLSANFSVSGAGLTKFFTNTSTTLGNIPASISRHATWNFGDGSPAVSNVNFTSHTYSAPGVYTVKLVNQWVDSNSPTTIYCIDSMTQQITVAAQASLISGTITWDSSITNLQQVSFKVWLIVLDTAQNTLTAVDSSIVSGWLAAYYTFSGHPAGSYRTKAAVLNGTNGANQLIPTYHNSSAFWNTASVINHSGGSTANKDIYMIPGTFAGGPGFIGGNISLGANKGTNGGVPNILVTLLNATNDIIRFTYTDANGDYSFGNVPAATYTVYPEHMNYITIPSSSLTVKSGQYNIGGVNFKHTPTHIMPIATNVANTTKNLFSIYPNPSTGNIKISWSSNTSENASVQITDVTGRLVFSTDTQTTGSNTINLSHLNAGVYLVKVVTQNAQHTERIVLQN